MEHPDVPEIPKTTRVYTTQGSYLFEPINNGKGTRLTYITEVNYIFDSLV